MFIFDKKKNKLARKITVSDIQNGLSFFSDEKDFLQVGSWRYEKGKLLKAHNHNIVPRRIDRTQEFIFVVQGAVKALVYDEADQLVQEVLLGPHEGMIMLSGGHGYEIQEDDSIIIEIKNGPYPGAETDRRRLEE